MNLRRLGTAAAITMSLGLGLATAGTAQASTSRPANYFTSNITYVFHSWSPQIGDGCLDDSNTGANGGDNLRTFSCNGQSYQEWKVLDFSNGWAQLQNQATGRCLDYSPGLLRTYPCNGPSFDNWYQAWTVVNRFSSSGAYEQVIKSGYASAGNGNICLDASNLGTRGYACNGASQDSGFQGWTLDEIDN